MTINDDTELRLILTTTRTVASVGASANEQKPSFGIFKYLVDHGYEMIPVNPGTPEIQGRKTYPDLRSIPTKIDVVQGFRKPEDALHRKRHTGRSARKSVLSQCPLDCHVV